MKLSAISKLKSPTKRRDTDGALHCRILISTKNNKYETQYFDSGIPMTELKSLYDKIEAIRNAINYDEDGWKDEYAGNDFCISNLQLYAADLLF